MYCDECGAKNPDGVAFCGQCGKKFKVVEIKKDEKNMILALAISFFLTGLGIVYAGNVKRGLLLFIGGLIFNILGLGLSFFKIIGLVIWVAALYLTYIEVKKSNGQDNPDILEDFKGFSTPKKIGFVVVVLIIIFIVIGSVIGALTPQHHYTTHLDDDYSSSSISSSGHGYSSSSGSGSSPSYSSSSNGRDVESHYEGEEGSADTHGTIYDDGSVESHQTGHTDYGDYQIDSYMDSNGKIHGTVDVGGHTYHVST